MSHAGETHGALMDDVYRYQRLFYDATRKYYLLGRDQMIRQMQIEQGVRVLEVACGTGRNLAAIGRMYPHARLYGLDISEQMLISARAKLADKAQLAQADACNFDPADIWDEAGFDHVVLSYSLSMIPDWRAAIAEALRHLVPGGTLHIVDFGDRTRLPRWFGRMLLNWLSRFHVSPRDALPDELEMHAQTKSAKLTQGPLFRTYALHARLTLPK